jgi:hypothetical protein
MSVNGWIAGEAPAALAGDHASVEQLTSEERRHLSALIASLLEQHEERDSPAGSGM